MFASNEIITATKLFLPNKKVLPSPLMINENINSLSNNALAPLCLILSFGGYFRLAKFTTSLASQN